MIMLRDCQYGDTSLVSAHFKVCEFQCKCTGKHGFQIDTVLIDKLEQLREKLNCSAINISSGFRCLAHDKAVGGSGTGQHIHGKAADICCIGQDGKPIDNKLVCIAAQDIGFTGIAALFDLPVMVPSYLLWLAGLMIVYTLLAQILKRIYMNYNHEWV